MDKKQVPYRILANLWTLDPPAEKLTDNDIKLNIPSLANSKMLLLSTVLTTLGNEYLETFFPDYNLAVDEMYLTSANSVLPDSYRQIVFLDGTDNDAHIEHKLRMVLAYFSLHIMNRH